MNTLLKDVDGNHSSKRVIGYVSFSVAVMLAVIALLSVESSPVAVDLVKAFLTFSGLILGATVAEKFGRK